jgi:ElaB/YqjD/DUF883 family membrane-anchored ribosome-binding protein
VAAVAQATSQFEEIKSKISGVISSTIATLSAKAQEVKNKIDEQVAKAQQIGSNIGPCVNGQSDEVENVLKAAGTGCGLWAICSAVALLSGKPS